MVPFSEQRANPRFRCRCYASLEAASERWPTHLVNISRSGCLVSVPDEASLKSEQRLELTIQFEGDEEIRLIGEVVHAKAGYVGLRYDALSDSDADAIVAKLEALKDNALT